MGSRSTLVARWLKVKGSTRPGLLVVGSTPWSIMLAQELDKLGTPTLVVDSSWQRLALARQNGLASYHGEILNEATEHNLDLTPYQTLVAATENEAYNTLVCNEFAYEIGRDSVYQLGEATEETDRHALPPSLRGRALFESGFGVADVNLRTQQGWIMRKTKLTEEFTFDDAQAKLPEGSHLLLLLRDNGRMRFFTHAARPEPRASDTVISFTPPDPPEKTKEEAAARRARKGGGRAGNPRHDAAPHDPAIPFQSAVGGNRRKPRYWLGATVRAAPVDEDEASATAFPSPDATGQSIIRPGHGGGRNPKRPPAMTPLRVHCPPLPAWKATSSTRQRSTCCAKWPHRRNWRAGGAITLRGHSDAGGSDSANMRVSRGRAEQVRDWLIEEEVFRRADHNHRVWRAESAAP